MRGTLRYGKRCQNGKSLGENEACLFNSLITPLIVTWETTRERPEGEHSTSLNLNLNLNVVKTKCSLSS